MASILKVDALTGVTTAGSISVTGEGNSTTTNLQQGLAKSWCNTNQSGAEIYDSFNIASLTDSGTGQQQPFFTNSMSNNRYAVELNVTSNINQTWCQNVATGGYVSKSYTGSAFEDREHLTTVHGDLA